MKSAIILLDKEEKLTLALKPVIDRRLIDFEIHELVEGGIEQIYVVADDETLTIKDVNVVKTLYEAVKALNENNADVIVLDGLYPNIKSDTYTQMFAHRNARIAGTQIIKLNITNLVNIKNILFDRVEVKEEDAQPIKTNRDVYELNAYLRKIINNYYLNKGVNFIDIERTYIGPDVVIEKNATIYPDVYLEGFTKIGANAVIFSGSYLNNAEIGENTKILSSRITDSKVGKNVTCGPNSHLRMNCEIGDNVRIGNFVEFKNTKFGYKSRCAHLTYLGDSTVGEDVNIGCGVITANYDGAHKFHTEIGDHSFIGSNSNLIAPIKIGANVLVAAGSTITDDVLDGDMAIARSRQTVKEGRGYTYIHKEK